MENQRGTMMKVCNFYISQWHLAMTLIPYLKTNMEQYEVGTLFERDMLDRVQILLSKIPMEEQKKKEILALNWYQETEKQMKQIPRKQDKMWIIAGNQSYVEEKNRWVDEWRKNYPEENIKIVNCYYLEENQMNMKDIMQKHQKILSTNGEKEIQEFQNQKIS